jgi:hypothetical protein
MATCHTRRALRPPANGADVARNGTPDRTAHSRNPGTGTVTDTYIYPANSNRLSSITLGAGGTRGLKLEREFPISSTWISGYTTSNDTATVAFGGSTCPIRSYC